MECRANEVDTEELIRRKKRGGGRREKVLLFLFALASSLCVRFLLTFSDKNVQQFPLPSPQKRILLFLLL